MPDVQDLRDVRMMQRGQHLGGASEADHVILAPRVAQDLDGHLARQPAIGRAEDDRARADPEDLEPIEAAAEQVSRALLRVRGEDRLEAAP